MNKNTGHKFPQIEIVINICNHTFKCSPENAGTKKQGIRKIRAKEATTWVVCGRRTWRFIHQDYIRTDILRKEYKKLNKNGKMN